MKTDSAENRRRFGTVECRECGNAVGSDRGCVECVNYLVEVERLKDEIFGGPRLVEVAKADDQPSPLAEDEVTVVDGATDKESYVLNAFTSTASDGRRATLVVGAQSFEVGPEYDTAAEVDWMRWMIAKALIEFREALHETDQGDRS